MTGGRTVLDEGCRCLSAAEWPSLSRVRKLRVNNVWFRRSLGVVKARVEALRQISQVFRVRWARSTMP
jgi:hypothetical protein